MRSSIVRNGILAAITVATLVVAIGILTNLPPPARFHTVRVATIATSLCGLSHCHYIGTTDGQVIQIYGREWVLAQVGLCYRVGEGDSTYGLQEVPCDSAAQR